MLSVLTDYFVQEVTLADLFHTVYCSLIFERLELGNLQKRPNLLR